VQAERRIFGSSNLTLHRATTGLEKIDIFELSESTVPNTEQNNVIDTYSKYFSIAKSKNTETQRTLSTTGIGVTKQNTHTVCICSA
jgi:hypothetical protein